MKSTFTLLLLFCLFIIAQKSFAQNPETAPADTNRLWKRSGSFNLGFTNVGLSNWAGGGQNSIALGSLFDLKAVRESEKSVWTNYLNVTLGAAKVGDKNNLFKKTDDQLILGTNYGYKISPKWSIAGVLELRTQLLPGYSYGRDSLGKEVKTQLISDFFAPAYLRTEFGIQYKDKILSLRLAPISNRITFVLNDSLSNVGAFGVVPGRKVRSELGPNFNATMELKLAENITFKSVLNMFANYEFMDRIDINWDNFLVMKVNKYVNVAFTTQLYYDHDILIKQTDGTSKQAIQFKHVLAVNFGVKF